MMVHKWLKRVARRARNAYLDLMLPAAEKIVLVLEGIGDDKIRIHSSSLDQPLTILPDQALEIVAIAKITIRPGSCVSLLACAFRRHKTAGRAVRQIGRASCRERVFLSV